MRGSRESRALRRAVSWRSILEKLEPRIALSGDPLVEPPVIMSDPVTHTLTATLTETIGATTIGDTPVTDAWTYNGSYVGPTLWAQPGDTLDLTIVNNISQVSNLHTHGLHVSPAGNSDNVLLELEPGESNRYTIKIPSDHPNGLNWYHAHLHGVVNDQLAKGLSGLLVVGRPDGAPTQLNGLTQHLIALKNARIVNGSVQTVGDVSNTNAQVYTVNGQLEPTLEVPVGRYDVFNVAGIGTNAFYNLQVFDPDSGQTIPVSLVATDGNPFNNAESHDSLLVPPAQRLSFVVPPKHDAKGNAIAGTCILQQTGYTDGSNDWPARDLMTINYTGATIPLPAAPVSDGSTLTPPNNYYRDLRNLPASQIAAYRTVVFGEGDGVLRLINNEAFPLNPIFQPRIGTIEEWTLANPTGDDHPFHLHVNPQQVVQTETNLDGQPNFQDVINVPAFQSVRIRVAIDDYLGQFVYHCHRTKHEDLGMMALVNVLPNRPYYALGANIKDGEQVVKVFDPLTSSQVAKFFPFSDPVPTGFNVAVGDVNGDGVYDIVVGTTQRRSNVRVIDGTRLDHIDPGTGVIQPDALLADFSAYTAGVGGVTVAVADINGDGIGDIVTGAGDGGGQVVKIIDGTRLDQTSSGGVILDSSLIDRFTALTREESALRVATGDINGDGRFDIIAAAGPGAAPRVRVFDGQDRHVLSDFLAYDAGMRDGVYVATGNVKGYAYTDIITGQGEGAFSMPVVKVFTNSATMHSTEVQMSMIDAFLAGDVNFPGGARVTALHDSTALPGYGSNRDSIVVAPATGDGTVGTIFSRDLMRAAQSQACHGENCCACCADGTCDDQTHTHEAETVERPITARTVAGADGRATFSAARVERIADNVVRDSAESFDALMSF